jgi:enamine deaminase RidA (YjgF/YER057c/UK114 family)
MPKEHLDPESLFPSRQYGFSQIVTARGGKTIYISGQVGWDERQQLTGSGDLRAQTWQALRNIETAVQAAGGTLADVVSMRIYLVASQLEESRVIQEALLEFFPDVRPTTTWICVPALANRDFLIEIEPIAVIE